MKQDLNNIVRTVRCAYIAFQNEHDISHKFKFRHLGATSTIYKSSEERPDLLKEFYINCNLFIEVSDKNILKNKFQLAISNLGYHIPYIDIIDINGVVTLKSLITGYTTIFLSDVMEKYEKKDRNILLTMDFTKHRLVNEIYLQISIHTRNNTNIEKNTRAASCSCDGTCGWTRWACCTNCKN